ncbi:hypothetical protein SAZ11_51405 [Streptomyces sp. FXJ1.4098]|nr:hypothetical protein [Streptomyces sp. FXJ1.4098]
MDELTGITVLEADGERLGPFVHRQVTAIDEAVAGAGAVLIRGPAPRASRISNRPWTGSGSSHWSTPSAPRRAARWAAVSSPPPSTRRAR